MNHLGWIDLSPVHHKKVMLVMDMFKDQGVIDEMGLGTIRDAISDRLFPGTSTIQTRAKYFLLIPWIVQDIERRGKTEAFLSEMEKAEIHFVKTLSAIPGTKGVIGATLRSANPKRKPSSIYWNGLKVFNILQFSGSLSEYVTYQKFNIKRKTLSRRHLVDADGDVPGDDRDAQHLYDHHLWATIPQPPATWKEHLGIELTVEEAGFLREKIIHSSPGTLWAYTLNHCAEEARYFPSLADFLLLPDLPDELRDIVQLAVHFNHLMQGALIRYNLLVQTNQENGTVEELQRYWEQYWDEMKVFDWDKWSTDRLWHHCRFTPSLTKVFVETWVGIVKANTFDAATADDIIRKRELRLKGLKRARLSDKALAQKQQELTGISRLPDGSIAYLSYRWNNVRTFLTDIQNGLQSHAATP